MLVSLVRPLGLLLLGEGLHTNLLVLAAEEAVEYSPLVLDAIPQRQVLALVDHLLGALNGHPRIAGDSLGSLQRLLHQLFVTGEGLGRKAPSLGVRTRERLAGQDQLHGLGLPDGPRQPLASTGPGDGAELDLRLPKVGALGAVEDVAHHGQLAPAAQGVTGHGGNDGLLDPRREVGPRLDEGAGVGLGKGEGLHLLDVGPRGEGLLGASQDDDGDAVRGVELGQGLVQLRNQRRAQGVECLGSVEGYWGVSECAVLKRSCGLRM